jgi:outer membrane autotransporter protein
VNGSNNSSELKINGGTVNIGNYGSIGSDKIVNINDGIVNLNGTTGVADIWARDAVNIDGGTINTNSGLKNYILLGADSSGDMEFNIGKTEVSQLNILSGTKLSVLSQTESWDDESCAFDPTTTGCYEKSSINLGKNGTIDVKGTLEASINSLATTSGQSGTIEISSGGVINGNIGGDDIGASIKLHGGAMSNMLTGNITKVDMLESYGSTIDKEFTVGGNFTVNGDGTTTLGNSLTVTGTTNITAGNTIDLKTNTLTTGTFTVGDNSTVAFQVSGKESGDYGNVIASTYNISSTNTTLQLTLDNGVLAKDESEDFTIFTNMSVDNFAELSENSRYTFVKKEGDAGVYTITGTATATDVVSEMAVSDNNVNTISAWIDSDSNYEEGSVAYAVMEKLNALSQNGTEVEIEKALTALAPETNGTVSTTAVNTFSTVANAVSSRMSGGFNSSSSTTKGMSSGDSKSGLAVWAQGLANHTKLENHGSVKGFKGDTNGIALGIEAIYTDEITLGLSYAYGNSDIEGYGRDTDIDSNTLVLYGEYKPSSSNLFVNGMLSYGISSYKERKDVADTIVKADYDANIIALQSLVGYALNYNTINVTPTAGLRYVSVNTEDYTDTADQRVSSDKVDVFTGLVGVRFDKRFKVSNTLVLTPEVKLGVQHDFKNDNGSSTVTLANGSSYVVMGDKLEKTLFEVGTGLGVDINNEWNVSVSYEGKFKDNYQDHTGLLNVRYGF